MPFFLSIGVTEEHFWESTPKELEPYVKAHEMTLEREDRANYTLGLYIYSAVGAVIGAAFGNKKAKYLEEPFSETSRKQKEMENMDEETKMKYVNQLFAKLGVMQTNFEMEKKRKAQAEQKTS